MGNTTSNPSNLTEKVIIPEIFKFNEQQNIMVPIELENILELTAEEYSSFYTSISPDNIKAKALKKKDTCWNKEIGGIEYIPFIWEIIAYTVKRKRGYVNLRIKFVEYIIEKIKATQVFEVESVGTPYKKSKSSSDVDLNIFYKNVKVGNNTNIEEEYFKLLISQRETNKLIPSIIRVKNSLDAMFDINLYPYINNNGSKICTEYDVTKDVFPHKRVSDIIKSYNLKTLFKKEFKFLITYNSKSSPESTKQLLTLNDINTELYASNLKDVYYSTAARCHIVNTGQIPKDSVKKVMYTFSLIDNFGFFMKTLFEEGKCTYVHVYQRYARACKYLARMCDAIIKTGESNSIIKALAKASNKVNEIRKMDYVIKSGSSDLNHIYSNIQIVFGILFKNITNKCSREPLDPFSPVVWIECVLCLFKSYFINYEEYLK